MSMGARSLALIPCATVAVLAVSGGPLACEAFSGTDTPGGVEAGTESDGGADGSVVDGSSSLLEGGGADGGDGGNAAVVLASGVPLLTGITATETTVYFTAQSTGAVHAVPIDGGIVTALSTTRKSPLGITTSAGVLYWCDFVQNEVSRLTLTTGVIVTSTPTPNKPPFAAAIAGTTLVLLTTDASGIGEVQQYDSTVSPQQSLGNLRNPTDVAAVDNQIIWCEPGGGGAQARIGRVQVGSASTSDIALGEQGCESVAADHTGAYWARPAEGLVRAALAPTSMVTDVATGEAAPASLVADDASLYWLDSSGRVRRLRHGVGALVETVAAGYPTAFGDPHVQALAVTTRYVVFLTTDGRVVRVAK